MEDPADSKVGVGFGVFMSRLTKRRALLIDIDYTSWAPPDRPGLRLLNSIQIVHIDGK